VDADEPFSRVYVDAITIASDGTVYVTVSRSRFHGVRASSDEGRHWERRMGDLPNAQMLGIAVDPTDPDVVYVGSLAGVHKTTDGGQTWSLFDEGLRTHDVLSVSVDGDGGAVHVGTGGGGVFDRGTS
jgi:photosystem II stability/assembly factor-like uncharacterized protein